MKPEVGNKVKVINENFEGVIKNIIQNNRLIITCTDGFDYEVSINEVLIIGEDNLHMYSIDDAEIENKIKSTRVNKQQQKNEKEKGVLAPYLQKTKYTLENILEIDLHLEELVEFPQKLDDWQKLHTQMQHVKNCINAAFDKNIRRIVFIHGVGTGVLKMELHNYLAEHNNLTLKDADFREYGMGATEVLVKN
jgi:hypothetical protein